jgi:hypothetical protein
MVADLKDLAKYPYCGHSVLMGKQKRDFQDVDYVLRLFGEKVAAARHNYREYVRKRMGIGQPAVSRAVVRGEKLAQDMNLSLIK